MSVVNARPSGKALLGIAAAALSVVAVVALIVDERGDHGRDVASVVREGDELLGERVTVTGRIEQVVGAKSFILTEGSHRLLVLDVSVIPAVDNNLDGVLVDELVTVTGVLRTLGGEEVERYVGSVAANRHEAFLGRPVLVADSFRPR